MLDTWRVVSYWGHKRRLFEIFQLHCRFSSSSNAVSLRYVVGIHVETDRLDDVAYFDWLHKYTTGDKPCSHSTVQVIRYRPANMMNVTDSLLQISSYTWCRLYLKLVVPDILWSLLTFYLVGYLVLPAQVCISGNASIHSIHSSRPIANCSASSHRYTPHTIPRLLRTSQASELGWHLSSEY